MSKPRSPRTRPCTSRVACAALSLGALLGCATPGADEAVERQSSALLGNDPARNAVSEFTSPQAGGSMVGARVGFGANAADVVRYKRLAAQSAILWAPWTIETPPAGGLRSTQRPFTWWEEKRATFSLLTNDPADSMIKDGTLGVFAPVGTAVPVGPATALKVFPDSRELAFARFSDNTIRQATLSATSPFWSDVALPIDLANPPTSSPILVHRDQGSASLWYACGPAGTTRVCEHRIAPATSAANNLKFNIDFGPGAFVDGTRPTAVGHLSTSQRFIFGVVQTTDGKRTLQSRRDGVLGQTTFQFGALTPIDSSTTATFSTAVPVANPIDPSVVYFKTEPGATTRIMKATWNNGAQTWGAPQEIHDTGVVIPAGNEPTPYIINNLVHVLFRLPFSDGVRDVVNLTATTTGYIKTLLPGTAYAPGVFTIAVGGGDLTAANIMTGDATVLGTLGTGTKAFVSDRKGLGYAVQGGALWEVNLNDGARRRLGTQTYNGSVMAYGMTSSGPRLWIVEGDNLRLVNLATGDFTVLDTGWTGVTSLAHLQIGDVLWYVRNGSLYSGVGANAKRRGAPGVWTGAASVFSDSRSKVYVFHGGYGVYAIDGTGAATPVRASANLVQQPTTFDSATWTKNRSAISRVDVTNETAPDGSTTADLWREDTTNGVHYIDQKMSGDPSRTMSWSLFVAPAGRSVINLYLTTVEDPASGASIVADLVGGTVTSSASGTGSIVGGTVERTGTSFFKVTITGKARAATTGTIRAVAYLMKDVATGSYLGDGSSGVTLWGGELKLTNDFPTPNLVVMPNDVSNAAWIKSRAATIFDGSGTRTPDDTQTAHLWREDSTNGNHSLGQILTADPQRETTFSICLKAGGRTAAALVLTTPQDGTSGATGIFDLVAKTATGSPSGTGGFKEAKLVDLGGGWFRASVTGKARGVAGTQVRAVAYLLPSPGGSSAYPGDGSSGLYAWGGEVKGTLDANASSALTSIVSLPGNSTPGATPWWETFYVTRANGELGKLSGVGSINESPGPEQGTVLGYQKLGTATWPAPQLMVARNY